MSHRISLNQDQTVFNAETNEIVLDAALRQHINLPHSCLSGTCGQCKAQLLSGEVEMLPYQPCALSEGERAAGNILLCRSLAQSDLTISMPQHQSNHLPPVLNLATRIAAIEHRQGVIIMRLTLPKAPFFHFLAGQYINLLLKNGHERSYSLASNPAHPETIELHIKARESGIMLQQLSGDNPVLQVKSIVRIRGPLGSNIFENRNKPLLLLATGTGIAPILSFLHTANPHCHLHLYWGVRHTSDFYCLPELQTLLAKLPHAKLTLAVSRPDSTWQGKSSYVQQLAAADYHDMSAYDVYACGHESMVTAAHQLFTSQHQLPPHAFFADSFTPAIY